MPVGVLGGDVDDLARLAAAAKSAALRASEPSWVPPKPCAITTQHPGAEAVPGGYR